MTAGRADYWRYMPAPRFRAHVIANILQKEHPGSVVDLGCGDGMLLAEIREAVADAELAGIDLSPGQIEQNRKTMPDVEWFVGNLESDELALPRGFEALASSEVIEHLTHPANFLRTAYRLASDGALLVLSTQSGPIGETELQVGHLRHFTKEEMTALLEDAGWQPVRVWNTGFPFQDLSKWAANLSPNTMMEHFGVKPYGRMQKIVAAVLRLLFLLNSRSRGAQLFAVARKRTT
ncbi:MAG TPA: class I SAM-dependent methyltransferase [Thermoanaerobaculia bacterium]|nr:class I SAM-dependent methyltransferase [Thermoanaerobaculia bacterium]